MKENIEKVCLVILAMGLIIGLHCCIEVSIPIGGFVWIASALFAFIGYEIGKPKNK